MVIKTIISIGQDYVNVMYQDNPKQHLLILNDSKDLSIRAQLFNGWIMLNTYPLDSDLSGEVRSENFILHVQVKGIIFNYSVNCTWPLQV